MRQKLFCLWVVTAAIACAGLAAYLTAHYYFVLKGTLFTGGPCSDRGIFDCSSVAFSEAGSLWGLPIALYGLMLYLGVAILGLLALGSGEDLRRAALSLVCAVAACMTVYDAYLLWVMFFKIKAICIFCLATHALNLALLISLLVFLRPVRLGRFLSDGIGLFRFRIGAGGMGLAWLITGFALAMLTLGVGGGILTRGLILGDTDEMRAFFEHQLKQQTPVVTAKGDNPSKGATQPRIEIVKFSDFECPSCRRASRYLKLVQARYPNEVSITYKNFPLDSSCNAFVRNRVHLRACRLALMGECAFKQNRFWEYHDTVFRLGADSPVDKIEGELKKAGLNVIELKSCAEGREAWQALQSDVQEAAALAIDTTPTLIINGYHFQGDLPPWSLEILMQLLLEKKT